MPKIRIHELAKELNVDNKKVMEFLKEKKIEVKSHMSTLEENQEAMVRKAFSPQTEKTEKKEEKAEKTEKSGSLREVQAEPPKKKSNIIQVFRPQNATTKEAKNFRRPGQNPRPAGRPAAGRPERPAGSAPQRTQRSQVAAQSTERPVQSRPQGDRLQGERPRTYGDRPQGERPRAYGGPSAGRASENVRGPSAGRASENVWGTVRRVSVRERTGTVPRAKEASGVMEIVRRVSEASGVSAAVRRAEGRAFPDRAVRNGRMTNGKADSTAVVEEAGTTETERSPGRGYGSWTEKTLQRCVSQQGKG